MVRRVNDAYYTLQADTAIDALLKYVPLRGLIFEPCVGEGHLSGAIERANNYVLVNTNDIDREVGADFHEDAGTYRFGTFDWIVTNPPFSQAFPILKNLLPAAQQGVAFLLRLTFLEPTYERGEWLEENPPDLVIVLPRMSFTGDGRTDSVTCAWMVWCSNSPAVRDIHTGIRIYPKTR